MRKLKSTILLLALAFAGQFLLASNGELLLFHNGSSEPVNLDFVKKYAPQIEEMAKSQGITTKLVAIENEAPELVRFTPAIVYQNHLGRSLYIGRYHYVDKIKTFMRTVKRFPQKDVVNEKHDVMVWSYEQSTIVTPVKITPLTGKVPADFDQKAFKKEALAALDEGMKNYRFMEEFDARRTHRLMYAAFYPHRSKDGKIYISMEVYSQFNCVDPVYKQFKEPVSGSFKKWEKVFAQAGAQVEEQIIAQLNNTERGDGLQPMGRNIQTRSFEDMGFPLPPAPAGASNQAAVDMKMPQKWIMDGPIAADVPLINFNFPAPLDYYAGEITQMNGQLILGKDAQISSSIASFAARLESMTMGDENLDLHVNEMISLLKYPKSSFTFNSISVVDQPQLIFGTMTQFVVDGMLDFKGLEVPVTVTSQIEPILNEAGQPRLQVYAFFKMPLKEHWDIDGPDGPEEASNFLDFNINFLMQPSETMVTPGNTGPIRPRGTEGKLIERSKLMNQTIEKAPSNIKK